MNTFYHGDCLFVMNHDIEPNSVDLIYLDPPFFTGKVQTGTAKWQPGATEVSYEDSKHFWKEKGLSTNAPEWLKHIALQRPDFAAYLFYMMERLQACHKVLSDKGSIYLHCDEKASHYLKMIMDEIFGFDHYLNEIIWHYGLGAFRTNSRFPSKHDTILLYSKNKESYTFNKLRGEITKAMSAKYCHQDGQGKYMMSYGKKYYLKGGKPTDDVWDLPNLSATDKKERVGYPTQKPLALCERIIQVSSNEGDIVEDPFCGCGTAIIAAQKLNRQWIGIDINKNAHEVSGHRVNELPLTFTHYEYVSRDLDEVLAINKPQGKDSFEEWVNRYFKAHKPSPDGGIDGITEDNTPIQTKAFLVNAKWVRNLFGDAILHPQVKKPCKHVILVSQVGFDDTARREQFKIKTKEDIEVELLTPAIMLSNNGCSNG